MRSLSVLEGIALASDPDYKVCLLGNHALWLTSPELGRLETQPVKHSLQVHSLA